MGGSGAQPAERLVPAPARHSQRSAVRLLLACARTPPLPARPPASLPPPPAQALGVSAGPAATVATSAAIKWITKDGLGAAGRLIVGGNLAQGAPRRRGCLLRAPAC